MKHTVEQTFCDLKHTVQGQSYQYYNNIFKDLIYGMRDKIGHPFFGEQYHKLRFFMNVPLYTEFTTACKLSSHDPDMYRGIRIILDPTLYIGNSQSPYGIVRLVYEEEPEVKMDKRLIYLGGRGTGKTKQMIDEAAKHPNSVIVVASLGSKISLEGRLQYEGKNHIKVMTINEMLSYWKRVGMRKQHKFFIDDVQNCLRTLMNNSGDIIEGMSINVAPGIDEVRSDVIAVSSQHNDYMDCLRYCMNRFETKEEKEMSLRLEKIYEKYCVEDAKANYDCWKASLNSVYGHGFQKVPHIDHVKFNGPATIVFWKDGTKTVVKHDGKGRKDKRQAILYAFIRKIYGEGKSYHNILNEIEEAVK